MDNGQWTSQWCDVCLCVRVQEQANWVCQCADEYVSEMAQAFRHALQAERSLEHWAQWLDELLGDHLARFSAAAAPADDAPAGPKLLAQGTARYIKHARLFLLKWSYFRCDRLLALYSLRHECSLFIVHCSLLTGDITHNKLICILRVSYAYEYFILIR